MSPYGILYLSSVYEDKIINEYHKGVHELKLEKEHKIDAARKEKEQHDSIRKEQQRMDSIKKANNHANAINEI